MLSTGQGHGTVPNGVWRGCRILSRRALATLQGASSITADVQFRAQETQSHEIALFPGKSGHGAFGSRRGSSKSESLWSKTCSRKLSSALRENVISDNIALQNTAVSGILRAWHAFCNCIDVRFSQLQ
jgi:hypothetical protein